MMKKTMRIALIAAVAVSVVGGAAIGNNALRASEEADSEYEYEAENYAQEAPAEESVPVIEVEPEAAPAETEETPAETEETAGEQDPAVQSEEAEAVELTGETEEETEEKEERHYNITVVSDLEGVTSADAGTQITLTAILEGFEGVDYELQWVHSADGINWEEIPGANGSTYVVTLNEETAGTYYNVNYIVYGE